jgi:hypothetical protein
MPTDRKQGYRASTFKMIDANAITAGSEETVWTPQSGSRIRLLVSTTPPTWETVSCCLRLMGY